MKRLLEKFISGNGRTDADQGGAALKIEQSDYQMITERILQVKGNFRSVLFAGAGLKCLPITIPVNVSVQLAQAGHRCLLIDLDQKRDAVAQVFSLIAPKNPLKARPYRTDLDNLLVWPAHNFTTAGGTDIRRLIRSAEKKFDLVLISAPYLDGNIDRTQIATAAACGFIFSQNVQQATRLAGLMRSAKCKVIGNMQLSTD